VRECVRNSQIDLPQEPAPHGASKHGGAGDYLAPAKHGLDFTRVPGGMEGVDQPGLGGAGEECEAEPDQHRDQDPPPDWRLEVPEGQVGSRCHEERGRTEDERGSPAERVCDHSSGYLEDHHAGGVSGIGDKRLGDAEPGIEQEEGVDPPDQGGGERLEKEENQLGSLHALRRHGSPRGSGS